MTLALEGLPAGVTAFEPPSARFATARGADVRITARRCIPPPLDAQRLLFDSGGPWRVYRHGRGRLYVTTTAGPGGPPDRALRIDTGLTRGELLLPARARGPALGYPLADLVFQHHLARRGGLVLHACGVVDAGRALVFLGASGAGKSTLARLWRRHAPGATVLSDDRVVLRRAGGRLHATGQTRSWRAFGTPWHGEAAFAEAASAPLAALFFLRQANRHEAAALAPVAAAAELFARSFPPLFDRVGLGRTLASCTAIARAVPAFELRFRRDAAALATARAALASLAG